MVSRIIAFGALALACIVAAGGGAYLAVRHNDRATQPQAIAQPAAQQQVAQTAPAGSVSTPPAAGDEGAAPAATPAPAPVTTPAPQPDADTVNLPRQASARSPRATKHEARAADSSAAEEPSQPQAAGQTEAGTGRPATGSVDPAQTPVPQPVGQPIEPQKEWVEVTVPSESVLGLQIQTPVSSETARIEDRVEARVTRDVRVGDRVAIPAGSQAIGSVVQVERGGKIKERAHFAIRFNSLILPDGSRLSLTAEAVHREGPSPANKSAAKIGGATVGGAILGAILGGGKGAAIGGAIGAGGGTAATMAGEREPATLAAGSIVNIRLMSPVTVTLER